MTTRTKRIPNPVTFIALITLSAIAGLSGCVGYTSWPPVPGTAMADPNSPRSTEVMAAALAWIIERDREGSIEPVAINLPSTMKPKFYRFVAAHAGENVEPLSQSNRSLPIYHVAEFHIRGSDAEAIILRPATELGTGPDGEGVYQGYRVELKGGFQPWHVTWWSKPYSVGAIETPPLTYIDAALATVDEPSGGE
jgi:hypothetical protein